MCFAQAVYTALKETEQRATDVLPLWKLPFLHPLIPRQRKAAEAVELIRETTEQLIAKCRAMVDAEEQVRPSTHGGSCLSCTRSSRAGAKLLRPLSSSGRQKRSSLPKCRAMVVAAEQVCSAWCSRPRTYALMPASPCMCRLECSLSAPEARECAAV